MCFLITVWPVWVGWTVLLLLAVWVGLTYWRLAKGDEDRTGFRLLTPIALKAYSSMGWIVAAFSSAAIWVELPMVLGDGHDCVRQFSLNVSVTGFVVGVMFAGAFIMASYRFFELGTDASDKNPQANLSNTQLKWLIGLAWSSVVGTLTGAWFLLAAIWNWQTVCIKGGENL